jgi:UDP-N-acetylglucosamine--N-acetylmuramyl-(pentapeptide) pyrophosphoryl-undecaprenol N-acetylglucosamine transferase
LQRLKLLFYAINGTGLGHLTRLLAVARSCRELLCGLDLEADIRFLTSSEASEVVWDFPVYKLPSKTVARSVKVSVDEFERDSKLVVTNLVASFAPDVLIVDTVPQGSYREISFLRSFVSRMVYIDRHKDPAVSQSELHQKHIALYDRVLIPDHRSAADRYHHSKDVVARRKFVGPIHLFNPHQALTRTRVRERFGVEPGQRLIYLTGGGGSDSRLFLSETVEKLSADPQNFVLIGWGPLHRGQCVYRRNVISLTDPQTRNLFMGVDAALSAGGYNTYQELLAARVPTVFYAQPKGMDRQDERIALGENQGWHLTLHRLDASEASLQIEKLWDEEVRGAILDSLDERPMTRGRSQAATEILALHSSLPHSPVSRALLFQTALWQRDWGGVDFPSVAVTARRWLKHMCHNEALEEQREQALLAWRGHKDAETRSLLQWAEELNELEFETRSELIRAWCHKNLCRSDEEVEQRAQARSTLHILKEQFPQWPERLQEIVQGFKRPYQRQALKLLAGISDRRQEPATDALAQLRTEPAPWGERELRLLEQVNATPIGR